MKNSLIISLLLGAAGAFVLTMSSCNRDRTEPVTDPDPAPAPVDPAPAPAPVPPPPQ